MKTRKLIDGVVNIRINGGYLADICTKIGSMEHAKHTWVLTVTSTKSRRVEPKTNPQEQILSRRIRFLEKAILKKTRFG